VGLELVHLDERPGVEEEVDALAGRELAGLVRAMRSSPPPRSAASFMASRSARRGSGSTGFDMRGGG
jgi:hypothetical protein